MSDTNIRNILLGRVKQADASNMENVKELFLRRCSL